MSTLEPLPPRITPLPPKPEPEPRVVNYLAQLAQDRLTAHRYQVATRGDTPLPLLIALANDVSPKVVAAATTHSTFKEYREQIAEELNLTPDLPALWRTEVVDLELVERHPFLGMNPWSKEHHDAVEQFIQQQLPETVNSPSFLNLNRDR